MVDFPLEFWVKSKATFIWACAIENHNSSLEPKVLDGKDLDLPLYGNAYMSQSSARLYTKKEQMEFREITININGKMGAIWGIKTYLLMGKNYVQTL